MKAKASEANQSEEEVLQSFSHARLFSVPDTIISCWTVLCSQQATLWRAGTQGLGSLS